MKAVPLLDPGNGAHPDPRSAAGHHTDVDVVRWHPNGHYLATASDRQLRLWDLRSGTCMRVLQAHTAAVRPPWWFF